MRQRVMIAMALALDPEVLIADEPTTALDVTIQAQILRLLENLNRDRNLSMVLITHDLGVVAELADRVVVMYGGQIVEDGPLDEIFQPAASPYTGGCWVRSRDSTRRARTAAPDSGPAAVAVEPAGRLPLRAALRIRRRRSARRRRRSNRASATPPTSTAAGWTRRPSGRPAYEPRRSAAGGHRPRRSLPHQVGNPGRPRGGDGARRRRRQPHPCTRAKPWAWSVNRAAASRRCAGRSCSWCRRHRVGPLRRGRTGRPLPARPSPASPRTADDLPGPFASLNRAQAVGQIIGDPIELHGLAAARSSSGGSGTPRARRAAGRALQPVPARVLRRATPADRHRPGAGPAAQTDHRRRAGVGAGRLGAGADHQPARGTQDEFGLSYLFVAHDLGVVRHVSDRVAVMYLGRSSETSASDALYRNPLHPTPTRCCPPCPSPTRAGTPNASESRWKVTFPARSTRRPGAGSTPAAHRPPTSAAPRSRTGGVGARPLRGLSPLSRARRARRGGRGRALCPDSATCPGAAQSSVP